MRHTRSRIVLVPHTAQARPEGLGCIRRCVGDVEKPSLLDPPTGRPYPASGRGRAGGTCWQSTIVRPLLGALLSLDGPKQNPNDSGISAVVCRSLGMVQTPTVVAVVQVVALPAPAVAAPARTPQPSVDGQDLQSILSSKGGGAHCYRHVVPQCVFFSGLGA